MKKTLALPANFVEAVSLSEQAEKTYLIYKSRRRNSAKLSIAESHDGFSFVEKTSTSLNVFNKKQQLTEIDEDSKPNLAKVFDKQYLTTSESRHLKIYQQVQDGLFDGYQPVEFNLPKSAKTGQIVSEFKHLNQHSLFYVHADQIYLAFSKDLKTWHGPTSALITPRSDHFDNGRIDLTATGWVDKNLAVLYQCSKTTSKKTTLSVGMVLLDSAHPDQIIWRGEGPVWQEKFSSKLQTRIIGARLLDDQIFIYLTNKNHLFSVIAVPRHKLNKVTKADPHFVLSRSIQNPLITPDGGQDWEAVGTFNPAVMVDEDKVHILYRALDNAGISFVGYAQSDDGINISYRSKTPAYWPRAEFEAGKGAKRYQEWNDRFASGGGWGGCEDPKVTKIGDFVYLTYVAHPGWGPPRLAMSKISLQDFRAGNWNAWEEPRLISRPGVVNKSGIILPEKINGKYVIFHRVFPNILIHYTDDLEKLGRSEWLEADEIIPPRPGHWDSRKLSIGATPILIDQGWLVIYHAVDDNDDSKYKIGAMLLDKDHPQKVIARTNTPILEPEAWYENEWKFGIAYPSGAAVIDGILHVYYGGGDRHVCVATAPLQKFVEQLLNQETVELSDQYLERPADVQR